MLCHNLFSYTIQLSIKLQDPEINLFKAIEYVKTLVSVLKNIRKMTEQHFEKIFKLAEKIRQDFFQGAIKKTEDV